MDIKKIKEKKKVLGDEILKLINTFEDEAECHVSHIYAQSLIKMDGTEETALIQITVEI